jgi:large subunit ribosomal protein L14
MKALKASMTRALNVGSVVYTCDNSGAKIVRLISVKGHKTRSGRLQAAGVADMVMVSVLKGEPGLKKQLFPAVIVRQKRGFRRPDGTRLKFEDNALVICKDEKGNPKGTMIKGAVAKEACERWTPISKLSKIII